MHEVSDINDYILMANTKAKQEGEQVRCGDER